MLPNQLTKNILQGQHVIIEATRYSKEGKPVDVSIMGVPVVIDRITVGGFGIYTDIGERKQAENALQKSEERYKQILSSIIEGYYETNLNGNITFFNDALCQLTGYSPEDLKNLSYKKIYPNAEKVYQIFNQVYRTGKPFQGFTLEVWNKNGSLSYAEISVSLLEDENGNIIGFRGLARDVTERKNFEERLKYLSLHDQLTGLHNRAYFQEELERLEGSRNYPITIIFADLDGLKLVNDTRGHQQGDEMLQICADAIKKCLRQEDLLARVGGDEFCAILPKTDENTGKEIVERIQSYLEHLNKDQPDYPLSISIGVSTVNNAEIPLQEAYIKADNLMNLEKLSRSTRLKNQTIRNLLTDIPEMSNLGREHISRLIPLCRLLGEGMGLAPLQLELLLLLVQMHDVGQSSIPAEILKKRGPLTAKEWNQIREHPEKGYRIARSSTELMPAADLILHHHEWWDGSGYPLGLKGEEIPIHCRILAVVDAFDVMTHQQYYRQAATVKEASDQLKLYSGKQFDPQVVEKFLSLPEIVKRLSR